MRRVSRTPGHLPNSIHQRLNMYAMSATAAGVGMLALAQPAGARIIYTPAHVRISQNNTIPLDLNHDGIKDFFFSDFYQGSENNGIGGLFLKSPQGNAPWASTNSAAALPAGVSIGPKGPFRTYGAMAHMFQTAGSFVSWGPWVNVKHRYLGFKFLIKGKTHFGWARLNVSNGHGGFSGTITGYAYETIPNKAIITGKTKGPDEVSQAEAAALAAPTPQPASLALLAIGSRALSVWRRKESALEGDSLLADAADAPRRGRNLESVVK